MPDMLAHYLVAEEAARRLDGTAAALLVAGARDAYKVGAQGPDVFFYANLLRRRGRPDLAHLTHRHRMSAAFRSLLGLAMALPADERQVALAFVAGYAAHLCLDAEAHPWVLYWTGDITEGADAQAKAQAFRRHGVLEASIDVILRQEQGGGPDWLRRRRLLRLPTPQRKIVAAQLSAMLREVFDVTFSPEECRTAFRTMDRVYGTMSDPYAFPTRLLATAAPLIDRSGAVRTQIYPETPSPVATDLVATQRRWYYPSLPDEPRTTTFREILEEAAAETARCLHAIAAVTTGEGTIEDAVEVIGDRSMLTGVACDDPRPPVAFAPDRDLIWGDRAPA
jgi:hypothetical protein